MTIELNLYTQMDLAVHLGANHSTIGYWVSVGKIPPAAYILNDKKYWTVEQLNEIKKIMKKPGWKYRRDGQMLYSGKEAARLLGMPYNRLVYLARRTNISKKEKCISQLRFTDSELEELRDVARTVQARKPTSPATKAEQLGLLSITRACKRLGIASCSWYYKMNRGIIARPSHCLDGQFYYTVEEVDSYRHLFNASPTS